ncbi:hypothetical protein DC31_06065 [Microbacterium sp. CH12i]|nr:hypothetical protein DC31_06065 [Microbacterium sp. CH12i]
MALLLILGASIGSHHEAESTPLASSSLVSATLPQADSSGAGGTANLAGAAISDVVSDSVMLGVAACLLGIICCFLLFVVARSLFRRVTLRTLCRLPRTSVPAQQTGRAFIAPLSLTQLSLSRT